MGGRKQPHKKTRKYGIDRSKNRTSRLLTQEIYKNSTVTHGIPAGFPSHFVTVLFDLFSICSRVFIFAVSKAPYTPPGLSCYVKSAMRTITFSVCSSIATPISISMSTTPRAVLRGAALFLILRFITHNTLWVSAKRHPATFLTAHALPPQAIVIDQKGKSAAGVHPPGIYVQSQRQTR